MTERAASKTAILVCRARAVADGRLATGAFSDPVARELLDAAELELVDRVRAGKPPADPGERWGYELLERTAVTIVPRTIAIDRAVREHHPDQVVVLGAGLDTRAWRMPELGHATVFEVDHPASQRDLLARIGMRHPLTHRLAHVPVDLATQSLAPGLVDAGFDTHAVTTWIWEGVIPYLTESQVRSTLRQLSALSSPGSRLVASYQARSLPTAALRSAMRVVLRISRQPDPLADEPWRSLWRPTDLRTMLHQNRFEVQTENDLLTLADGLGISVEGNGGSLRNGRVAIATRR
ncbi:MAG TPA: class I SAM-dependent methyltransferase [Propionicimonas sp.]